MASADTPGCRSTGGGITQNHALIASLFCIATCSNRRCPLSIRAKRPKRLLTFLQKIEAFLKHAKLLYGGGLRLMECLRLRVKDLDFAQRQIIVRDGKGMEDRVTMLPESLIIPLQEH